MEFFGTVDKRKSVRAFLDRMIDAKTLNAILETINLAPSAGNLQAYKVVVVKSRTKKDALANAAYEQDFIAQAPVVLVFLADLARSSAKYGNRGASLYAIQDATIAAAYAQLAATALGLGSVWIGAFDEHAVAKIIGANEWERPVAIMPIGYAAEEPERHKRRKPNKLFTEL